MGSYASSIAFNFCLLFQEIVEQLVQSRHDSFQFLFIVSWLFLRLQGSPYHHTFNFCLLFQHIYSPAPGISPVEIAFNFCLLFLSFFQPRDQYGLDQAFNFCLLFLVVSFVSDPYPPEELSIFVYCFSGDCSASDCSASGASFNFCLLFRGMVRLRPVMVYGFHLSIFVYCFDRVRHNGLPVEQASFNFCLLFLVAFLAFTETGKKSLSIFVYCFPLRASSSICFLLFPELSIFVYCFALISELKPTIIALIIFQFLFIVSTTCW